LILFSASRVSADGYAVTDLGTLGGPSSYASGINNGGDVVGGSYLAGGATTQAFVYRDGVMAGLEIPGTSYSSAYAINNRGQIVGTLTTDAGANGAFMYSDGVVRQLGTNTEANGINSLGQVVGLAVNTTAHVERGLLYSAGATTILGTFGGSDSVAMAINDSGQAVGWADTPANTQRAFLYSDGVMTNLGTLGGTSSYAYGINNLGQVVGISYIAGEELAFMYSDGMMTNLGTLGGRGSEAFAVNNAGQVVGDSYSTIKGTGTHAALFSGGVVTDISPAGWSNTSARGISDNGQIVGQGTNPQGELHAFLLTPVAGP
jgi:probable HAF family extracellular repeat protein